MTAAVWKSDTLDGLARGSRVWVLADGRWALGTLQSVGAGSCSVTLDTGGAVVAAKPANVVPANPALLDSVEDLTHLSFLNQPSILHALQQRYAADSIYTHAGPVLIAVNPHKAVPVYGPEHVQHYKARSKVDVTEGYAPHVFLTADKAYKQVRWLKDKLRCHRVFGGGLAFQPSGSPSAAEALREMDPQCTKKTEDKGAAQPARPCAVKLLVSHSFQGKWLLLQE
jgi:hypothetical protein